MQPPVLSMEIKTARENQLFDGQNFHMFIYNKVESISGLHEHDYYEFTIVLTGRYLRVQTSHLSSEKRRYLEAELM